ncbi:hypothetical protein GCM10028822_36750 [Hymenobacter terrigena]
MALGGELTVWAEATAPAKNKPAAMEKVVFNMALGIWDKKSLVSQQKLTNQAQFTKYIK